MAIEKTKRLAKRLLNQAEPKTTIIIDDDDVKDDEKWDCETVLTTYSNIYNHPKLIAPIVKQKIRLSNKTGLPLQEKKQSVVDDDDDDDQDQDDDLQSNQSSMIFQRKKGETSEERRARKHAVKEIRKVYRISRKKKKQIITKFYFIFL